MWNYNKVYLVKVGKNPEALKTITPSGVFESWEFFCENYREGGSGITVFKREEDADRAIAEEKARLLREREEYTKDVAFMTRRRRSE